MSRRYFKRNVLSRLFSHATFEIRGVSSAFSKQSLSCIEKAIASSERLHSAELRIAIESAMPLHLVTVGISPRARALDVFSNLRVWDTVNNNGILIYIGLADHAVEIVADRGINGRLSQDHWDAVCTGMIARFKKREFERGVVDAISALTQELTTLFPVEPFADNLNELPNRPVLL